MDATGPDDNQVTGISRIFIGVDSSAESMSAATCVSNIAPSGATIRIASIVENPRALVAAATLSRIEFDAARAELRHDALEALATAAHIFEHTGRHLEEEIIDLSMHGGNIAHALIDAADVWRADLLVAGSRRRHGGPHWVDASISERLAKQATCPVLVVPCLRQRQAGPVSRRILFAVDGSAASMRALRYGMQFAIPGAHLRVTYIPDRAVGLTGFMPVYALGDMRTEKSNVVLAAAEKLLANVPGGATVTLDRAGASTDGVAHTLAREASRWNADLLVMGTQDRRGPIRYLAGSVAQRVARIVDVPLLLVHEQRIVDRALSDASALLPGAGRSCDTFTDL